MRKRFIKQDYKSIAAPRISALTRTNYSVDKKQTTFLFLDAQQKWVNKVKSDLRYLWMKAEETKTTESSKES